MLTGDELQRFAPEGISNSYLGDAEEVYEINGLHILVYDHNIAVDFFDVR